MTSNPRPHRRRSIRLPDYDYTQPGAYFVTICAHNRECLFGDVVNGHIHLNDIGRMLWAEWHALPARFPRVRLDSFVVMPNHVHGILWLVGAPLVGAPDGAPARGAPTNPDPQADDDIGAPARGAPTGPGHGVDDDIGAPARGALTNPDPQADADIGAPARGAPTNPDPQADDDIGAPARGALTNPDPRADADIGAPARGALTNPDPRADADIGAPARSALTNPDPRADADIGAPARGALTNPDPRADADIGAPARSAPTNPDPRVDALGNVVGAFKSITANRYLTGAQQGAWMVLPGRLWQRNYYEHIIRNEDALHRIRAYIRTNPDRWADDPENPERPVSPHLRLPRQRPK